MEKLLSIEDVALQLPTSQAWLSVVMEHFDDFLVDHASCEKKAAAFALSLVSHYHDRSRLILDMVDLAVEEILHYRSVVQLLFQRGKTPLGDQPDIYVKKMLSTVGKGKDNYLLHRLIVASIIELRGGERFRLIADHLEKGTKEQKFYHNLAVSESKHHLLFLELALHYCDPDKVFAFLEYLLPIEAEIISSLPVRPALH